MLQHNLTIAWRNFKKERFYAWIKIGGFALGISACLLIALYIRDELSIDRHLEDADRLYRLTLLHEGDDGLHRGAHFPAPMAAALQRDYPEIIKVGRANTSVAFGTGQRQIRKLSEVSNHTEDGFTYVDANLLELLGIEMVLGDRSQALRKPKTIVIPEEAAFKYFGDQNPIGEKIILEDDNEEIYTIDGVIKDPSKYSHFPFKYLISLEGLEVWPGEQTTWASNNYLTYFQLAEGASAVELTPKLQSIVDRYILPGYKEIGMEDFASRISYDIIPIQDIHLKSGEIIDGITHGDIRFIWLFAAIAMIILLLACINFVNLSTAKAANRAKEVGLRKTVGGGRRQLITQFLTESILYSFISFTAGVILTYIFLPLFNEIADKSLAFPLLEWWTLPGLFVAAVIMGVISGFYPAIYLSSFRPIDVLKGSLSLGAKSSSTRSSLVVFQFATAIALIISTIVIGRQVNFILNKDIGYDKEQVLLLEGTYSYMDRLDVLKEQLNKLPEVQSTTVTNYLPVEGKSRNGNLFWISSRREMDSGKLGQYWRTDHDYIKTLGLRIKEGRDFDKKLKSDTSAAIITEGLAKLLGLEKPVGSIITNGGRDHTVIGVIEDFHFASLKGEIKPLCLALGLSPSTTAIKLSSEHDLEGSIAAVQAVWADFAPQQPFNYRFLDQEFAMMHQDVTRMGYIFRSFALLSIIIACLGLFALSAYVVEQRKKEISIHLVLGASLSQIFQLITIRFLKLVLISALIASPLAWYAMNSWLKDFAYRINIGWDVFVVATLAALFIALLTLSYQSLKAAMMNPVDSLRS